MRKEIAPGFIATVAALSLLYFGMSYIQPFLQNNAFVPGFIDILVKASEGSVLHRILWFIGDCTEANFYKSTLASIFVVVFGILAFESEKKGKPIMNSLILSGSGMFYPVLIAAFGALIISNLLYFVPGTWTPTFVPFVSSAPVIVLIFGKEPQKLVTSAVLAGLVTYPISDLINKYIGIPLEMPGFCGPALGMAVSTVLLIEICRILPWMKAEENPKVKYLPPQVKEADGHGLFFKRFLADPGELVFWGSPLSTIGLLSGALLSWVLNPSSIVYSSGKFPDMLCGIFITVALAVFMWYPKYKKGGFAFTFAAPVAVGATINSYNISLIGFVCTAVVCAYAIPAIVHFMLEKVEITKRWHPCPIALATIAVVAGVWSLFVTNIPFFMA